MDLGKRNRDEEIVLAKKRKRNERRFDEDRTNK
jgi:hypothetical protein